MLGGIVASFFMFAPIVCLFLALLVLLGMISLAVVGLVGAKKEPEITLTVPRVEKAS